MFIKYHITVLKKEVTSFLGPEKATDGSVFVDATLGDGGHTEALAETLKGRGLIISIDRDSEAISRAQNRLNRFKNIEYINAVYENLDKIFLSKKIDRIDGIVFDLGISSYQLDESERGFSFSREEKLDMRMSNNEGMTASQLLNSADENILAEIIWQFGEERWSRRIAGEIVRHREKHPIENTLQLVEIVKKAVPRKFYPKHHHVATKTFQAIRIAVNKELIGLKDTLKTAVDYLKPGGRICVISFHSLEDRITKETFKWLKGGCICPPRMPECGCNRKKVIKILTSKPVIAKESEVDSNPRSRSAHLRVGEKL